MIKNEEAFSGVKIDLWREFFEALQLMSFEDPERGFTQLNSRRSQAPPAMPRRSISSIHKAKGLECENALMLPAPADADS